MLPAVVIHHFRKFDNWKPIKVDNSVPLFSRPLCPADQAKLKTVVALVGNEGKNIIRLGCCGVCGYVGYIDVPTQQWVEDFYARVWDRGEERDISDEIKKWQQKYEHEKEGRTTTQKAILKHAHEIHKDRPVCDIGCGYGVSLKKLSNLGFTTLIGMEASEHRARIAKEAFGVTAIISPFEHAHTQQKLREQKPFGLLYSHHVLEHIYNPREFIRLCSSLQEPGGYIVLTQPHLLGEFSIATTLYVPHLNAFSKFSLQSLLNAFGYEVVDDSFTTHNELCLVARKTVTPRVSRPESKDYYIDAVKKFSAYFNPLAFRGRQLFWAFRDIDLGGRLPYFGENALTRLEEIMISRTFSLLFRKTIAEHLGESPTHRRKFLTWVTSAGTRRHTDAPIEIQFPGNIVMMYK